MKYMNSLIKFLTICSLGGTLLTNASLFSSSPIIAEAKVPTTTTKSGITVYNVDNLKSGDHYIPAGVNVHYRNTHNGIQIWSPKETPVYDHNYEQYLRHNHNHKYIVTYQSLRGLGIKPLSKKQNQRYRDTQQQINQHMNQLNRNSKHGREPIDYGPVNRNSKHKRLNHHKPLKRHNHKNKIRNILARRKARERLERDKKRKAEMKALRNKYNQGKRHRPKVLKSSNQNKPQGHKLPQTGECQSILDVIINMLK